MNSAGSPPVIFTVLEEDASTDGARARGTLEWNRFDR